MTADISYIIIKYCFIRKIKTSQHEIKPAVKCSGLVVIPIAY